MRVGVATLEVTWYAQSRAQGAAVRCAAQEAGTHTRGLLSPVTRSRRPASRATSKPRQRSAWSQQPWVSLC